MNDILNQKNKASGARQDFSRMRYRGFHDRSHHGRSKLDKQDAIIRPKQQSAAQAPITGQSPALEQSIPVNTPSAEAVLQQPLKPTPAVPFQAKARFWTKLKTKHNLIFAGTLVSILVLAGIIFAIFSRNKPIQVTNDANQNAKPTPSATPVIIAPKYYSALDGKEIANEVSTSPVFAAIIENTPEARPQSGLLEAGVVYEAIAEGGITRFVALYKDNIPKILGPIRSARPYYIDWLNPYQATFLHVGGSVDAKNQIASQAVNDLDEFYNGQYYYREPSREAPHPPRRWPIFKADRTRFRTRTAIRAGW